MSKGCIFVYFMCLSVPIGPLWILPPSSFRFSLFLGVPFEWLIIWAFLISLLRFCLQNSSSPHFPLLVLLQLLLLPLSSAGSFLKNHVVVLTGPIFSHMILFSFTTWPGPTSSSKLSLTASATSDSPGTITNHTTLTCHWVNTASFYVYNLSLNSP